MKFLIKHRPLFDKFKIKKTKTRQMDQYMYPINNLTVIDNNALYMCIQLFIALKSLLVHDEM